MTCNSLQKSPRYDKTPYLAVPARPIFCNLRNDFTSRNQKETEGGLEDFQRSKIQHLAKSDSKANIFKCVGLVRPVLTGSPKIAKKGSMQT